MHLQFSESFKFSSLLLSHLSISLFFLIPQRAIWNQIIQMGNGGCAHSVRVIRKMFFTLYQRSVLIWIWNQGGEKHHGIETKERTKLAAFTFRIVAVANTLERASLQRTPPNQKYLSFLRTQSKSEKFIKCVKSLNFDFARWRVQFLIKGCPHTWVMTTRAANTAGARRGWRKWWHMQVTASLLHGGARAVLYQPLYSSARAAAHYRHYSRRST
jgi:hypothetical protein